MKTTHIFYYKQLFSTIGTVSSHQRVLLRTDGQVYLINFLKVSANNVYNVLKWFCNLKPFTLANTRERSVTSDHGAVIMYS